MKKWIYIFIAVFVILTINAEKFIGDKILMSLWGQLFVLLMVSGVITGAIYLVADGFSHRTEQNPRIRR